MPTHLFWRVSLQVLREQGARSDQAHLPANDVDQFRQFVDAGAPEESSERCQPFSVREQFILGVPSFGHGAKL